MFPRLVMYNPKEGKEPFSEVGHIYFQGWCGEFFQRLSYEFIEGALRFANKKVLCVIDLQLSHAPPPKD